MQHSLLDDPLFTVRRAEGQAWACTLPEVLAALANDDVLAFEALQPHQQQPWHSFLVQLAAMAVARETGGTVPTDPAAWRAALLALAEGSEAAWHLVVADVSEPAFMQSPVPEGSLEAAKYKSDESVATPDLLDVLITSKNHDVKMSRIAHPRPEHWVFALCALQTMEGFLGRGNYGVVRMNGGFGNRPMVGLTPGLALGQRFRRDLAVLLAERDALAERYDLGGHALLWTQPWDGGKKSGLLLEDCDPYFIEVCRRIRFTEKESGGLRCWRANTKAQRVSAPDDLSGRTGDPWTPVEKKGAKALTVGAKGFTYDQLQQIFLSGEYARPAALEFQEDERGGVYLVARTMVRGQGKTDGLHHRVVRVAKKASKLFFGDNAESERERLARRAQQWVEKAHDVQRKVLYPAVAALLSSGRNEKVDWDRVAPWIDAFDRAVDERFFDRLWASVDLDDEEAAKAWQRFLWAQAQPPFEEAERGTPIAAIHRWHARSKARSIFEGSARRVLPDVFESSAPASNQTNEVTP